ncbi:hypothetical protein [Nonomuraea sp. 10N515B]|uniref:hypothetical protein n=1 Tax=Nonomuraea sp. 10N515B TaxID=3457422 RepID=UPI003FCE77BB
MTNLRHLPTPAPAFERGDLVTHNVMGMPFVIVAVKAGYADLFPGDDLTAVSAVGRVLASVRLLTRREQHYVTIEPISAGDDLTAPPRLCIAEHRTGQPTYLHGTEGFVPLPEMRKRARTVAAQVGAEYREPAAALAIELLRGVRA